MTEWHGTPEEREALERAIKANDCRCGQTETFNDSRAGLHTSRVVVCEMHELITSNQTVADRLLYRRRMRDQLLEQEARP